jgi:MFS family permease
VLLTNLASVVFGFAMFAMSLVLPQLLELPRATGYGLGQSVLVAGLCLGPSGLVMMAVAPLSARITATAGPKTTLMAGAVVIATGYGIGIALTSAVWQLILVSAVVAAGIGLAYAAMPSLIMSAVPPGETAAANSLNSLMRAFGTSVASAVAGVILAHMTVRFHGFAVPALTGFRTVMAVGSGAALFAFAVASFLPSRARPTADGDASGRSAAADATATQPVR